MDLLKEAHENPSFASKCYVALFHGGGPDLDDPDDEITMRAEVGGLLFDRAIRAIIG